MSDNHYSAQLRNLSREYYQGRIGFEEYRTQRKDLLDSIDEEFNGNRVRELQHEEKDEVSVISRTIEFFTKDDVE